MIWMIFRLYRKLLSNWILSISLIYMNIKIDLLEQWISRGHDSCMHYLCLTNVEHSKNFSYSGHVSPSVFIIELSEFHST